MKPLIEDGGLVLSWPEQRLQPGHCHTVQPFHGRNPRHEQLVCVDCVLHCTLGCLLSGANFGSFAHTQCKK